MVLTFYPPYLKSIPPDSLLHKPAGPEIHEAANPIWGSTWNEENLYAYAAEVRMKATCLGCAFEALVTEVRFVKVERFSKL
jgi:hypothetical protein